MLIEAPRGTKSSIKCVHVTCMLSLLLKQHYHMNSERLGIYSKIDYRLYL